MSLFVSKEVKLVIYIVVIYVCFVYWGYVQEKLVSNDYHLMVEYSVTRGGDSDSRSLDIPPTARWDMSLVLNCCMATVCTLACLLIEQFYYMSTGEKNIQPDPIIFMRLSLTCVVASPLSYQALKYISFPLMVLAKSSKPIPVMLIGVLQFGKTYSLVKYISVLLLVVGITLFSMAANHKHDSGDSAATAAVVTPLSLQILGIVLIFANLILDGYTNNQQDAVFAKHKVSSLVMMKYTNMWQILWLAGFLILAHFSGWGGESGSELSRAVFMIMHYEGVARDVLLFCICAAIGQLCVFRLMQEFGSLVWICVSVVRKLFTVLLSVVMFNHSINQTQWMGLALTFSGILLDAGMSIRVAQQQPQSKVETVTENIVTFTLEKTPGVINADNDRINKSPGVSPRVSNIRKRNITTAATK